MTADKLCFNSNNLCTLAVENVYFTPLNSVGYIVQNTKKKSSAENSSTHKIKIKNQRPLIIKYCTLLKPVSEVATYLTAVAYIQPVQLIQPIWNRLENKNIENTTVSTFIEQSRVQHHAQPRCEAKEVPFRPIQEVNFQDYKGRFPHHRNLTRGPLHALLLPVEKHLRCCKFAKKFYTEQNVIWVVLVLLHCALLLVYKRPVNQSDSNKS